ncbi:uncharacterized protein LOC143188227 [Calliopsis andreniformis]|uniref:uncharacterized protein LOC143188227 n=1 Tax=Calliopsis andreniformis TaxID=337506 RepID=UPI003FCD5232
MDRTISLRQPLERDNESKDTELKLLYDEYLQKIMTEIILKKKLEEKEKLFLSRLATVAKECDSNLEKLFKLETRERDIIYLTKIQNDIDAQIIEVNKVTKNENIKMLKSISSQLYSLLQYVDVLRCNNVILPESSEEWNELHKTLKSCNETLKFIMDLIGTKSETYQSLNNDIKDFLNTYNNIQDHHKRLEKELGDLQALVLKTTSLSLM